MRKELTQHAGPLASLSLDLDNQWSYMKTHGDAGWQEFPSYLDVVVPRVLQSLAERDLQITFFVVGQDAALERNRESLAALSAAGHEIGNHSFHHEPWLHLRSQKEINEELAMAEEKIEEATGVRTRGFRGPGFSFSSDTIEVLCRREYKYDASTFPTFLGPMARAYYFMTAKLDEAEMEKRKELFGKLSDGFRTIRPYQLKVGNGSLTEIPVTTLPIFKIPIHVSYLIYLSRFSPLLAKTYFRIALELCAITHSSLSLLLHPLDFLGTEDVKELSFFPGMDLGANRKIEFVSDILDSMSSRFRIVSMEKHACSLNNGRAYIDAGNVSTV